MTSNAPKHGAVKEAWGRKWSFLFVFLLVFFTTASLLSGFDLLPEGSKLAETDKASLSASATLGLADTEKPMRIEIPEIGLEANVQNPSSTDVAVLDKALLSGAVRYPTSSNLGETGNVIIFGHSSYLPVVHNSSYKAFNDIQDLKAGDQILVTGQSRTFVYAVENVYSADANQDSIPLTVTGSKLTLATCDSFGKKTDRFIVVAGLVESYPVGK